MQVLHFRNITYVIVLFFLFFADVATAQQVAADIIGNVIDKDAGLPIEFANVLLLSKKDSITVTASITDKNGQFLLTGVPAGSYMLRCSYVGFLPFNSQDIFVTGKEKKIKIDPILLESEGKKLAEVIISGTKPMLNASIDRKIYDVTKDIMAQSGTASDILKNIPSLEVDIDGNVSLRGAGDVIILLNGRPSPLFGKMNKAEVLQQFPANTIEKIEVISNPSARYKPDGTSGIINIVLKKQQKSGINGSITANAGNRDRYNSTAILNYNPGKWNVFGSIGLRKDSRRRTNTITRDYFDTLTNALSGYYTEDGNSFARPITSLATLGFTYSPNKNNNFGISGNYSSRNQVKNDISTRIFSDVNHAYTNYFDRLRYDPELEREKDMTAFYEHNFPGEEHTLRIELNVSSSKENEDNHYQNRYYFPNGNPTFDNTKIFQGDNQQQLAIDYSRAFSGSSKLEAGYLGSFNQQDFNFYGEYFDYATSAFVEDTVRTNRFLFDQYVHALYGTYQKSYGKFGYSLGLRLEEAIIKGYQVTQDTSINNNYLKLYPTLHLSYELTDKAQLQLSYSRRVRRPEGDDINPFPEYQDPYNLRAGNPKLLPEIIHSFELGYKWQNSNFSFVPSLYYRYKENGFTQVTVPLNDSVLLTTQQNLSSDKSAGLELIFSAKAGNFFSSNLSTNLFYNQIQAENLGYFDKRNIISFSTNLNSTFTVSPKTMAQVSAIYYSSRVTPQGKKYPAFVLNAGIRQDFFKKKLSATLTAFDILGTLWQKTELNTGYLKQLAIGRKDRQVIYLGISYRFGKILKQDKIKFDE